MLEKSGGFMKGNKNEKRTERLSLSKIGMDRAWLNSCNFNDCLFKQTESRLHKARGLRDYTRKAVARNFRQKLNIKI